MLQALTRGLLNSRGRAAVVLALAVLALTLAGCGSSGGASNPSSSDTQSHGDQQLPANRPRPAPIIYRPHGLSRAHEVPLLIALHPSGDTPSDWRGETRLGLQADKYGFVVAYLGSLAPKSPAWRKKDLRQNLAYISSEIRTLVRTEHVDPKRVYVMGFSAGATTAFFVACSLSSQVAGVAAVSGAMLRDYPCHLEHPVSALLIIGTHDLVPVNGNANLLSATDVAAKWRALNACGSAPVVTHDHGAVHEQTWAPCPQHTAVGLYLIIGGHHKYPGEGGYPPSDPDSQLKASQAIWQFFATHPG